MIALSVVLGGCASLLDYDALSVAGDGGPANPLDWSGPETGGSGGSALDAAQDSASGGSTGFDATPDAVSLEDGGGGSSDAPETGPDAVVVPPDPLAPECDDLEHHPERSYLADTELDGVYTDGVPESWTGFSVGDATLNEETSIEKWGRADVRVEGVGAFRAGIFQTVDGLVAGKWYHAFYATAQKVFGGPNGSVDGSLPILREVGVDLGGGTDPSAPSIVWGRAAGGLPDKQANEYGGWKTLGNGKAPLVTFVATGPKVTVFLRASGWDDVTSSQTWIDSAFLVDACQDGY